MGDKSQQDVESASQLRDDVLMQWCEIVNTELQNPNFATYTIKTDCHDYNVKMLKHYFYTKPHLAVLIQDYITKPSITIDDVLDCNPNLTFIAILQGSADASQNLKPLFNRIHGQDWTRENKTTQDIILTKDYLDYLRREFSFQIKSISSIFFYRKCTVFNQIFQNLVTQRAAVNITPCRKQLLKKIINYSSGFFGYNQNKPAQPSHKIVSKLTKYYDIAKHTVLFIGELENKSYYIKTTYKANPVCSKPCPSPLPIYCSIVEYGKMKMTEVLTFLDFFLLPESYKHLYSNTDNIVIALSTDVLEEAVKPHLKYWYSIEQSFIFSNEKPGFLKEEFNFPKESQWKFVSPLMQNYSILTKDPTSVHKSSAFSHVSTLESYQYSLRLLDRQSITFSQPRRINKIVNTDTFDQNFVMKLKD